MKLPICKTNDAVKNMFTPSGSMSLPAYNGKPCVFVFWSGGLDSTFLIYHLLSLGYKVLTGHIALVGNTQQMKREEKARAQIYERFLVTTNSKHLWEDIGEMMSLSVSTNNHAILGQMWVWLSALAYVPCEDVAMGYVCNDDAISYIDDMKQITNVFNKTLLQRPVTLHFPLIKLQKPEMFYALPTEIQQLITYCESSTKNNKPCGTCKSCKRMDSYGLLNYTSPEIVAPGSVQPMAEHIVINQVLSPYPTNCDQ